VHNVTNPTDSAGLKCLGHFENYSDLWGLNLFRDL